MRATQEKNKKNEKNLTRQNPFLLFFILLNIVQLDCCMRWECLPLPPPPRATPNVEQIGNSWRLYWLLHCRPTIGLQRWRLLIYAARLAHSVLGHTLARNGRGKRNLIFIFIFRLLHFDSNLLRFILSSMGGGGEGER